MLTAARVETFSFYLDLMRKLELVKFTVNFSGINQKIPMTKYLVEIDNVRIKDQDDKMVLQTLSSKYGREYYSKMKRLII